MDVYFGFLFLGFGPETDLSQWCYFLSFLQVD